MGQNSSIEVAQITIASMRIEIAEKETKSSEDVNIENVDNKQKTDINEKTRKPISTTRVITTPPKFKQNSSSEAPIYNVANGVANPVTATVIKSPSCIHIKVGGQQFIARVSTGTPRSICSKKVLETLKIAMDGIKEKLIAAPMGFTMNGIGKSQLSIIIGNAQIDHIFFVVEQLLEDFIIGTDIVKKFGGMTIRDHGKKLIFGD